MELADSMSIPRNKTFDVYVEYVKEMKETCDYEQHGTEIIFFKDDMQFYSRAVMKGNGVSDFLISNNVRDDIIYKLKLILNDNKTT